MTQGQGNKGNLAVVRGGCYGRRPSMREQGPMDRLLDRTMRTAFVALVTDEGRVASRGIQNVREGLAAPWRILGRRFKEAKAAGVSYARAKQVVMALDCWIDALYAQDHHNDRGAA